MPNKTRKYSPIVSCPNWTDFSRYRCSSCYLCCHGNAAAAHYRTVRLMARTTTICVDLLRCKLHNTDIKTRPTNSLVVSRLFQTANYAGVHMYMWAYIILRLSHLRHLLPSSNLPTTTTPWAIKTCHFYFYDNFGKCGPISIILSLLDSQINCGIR